MKDLPSYNLFIENMLNQFNDIYSSYLSDENSKEYINNYIKDAMFKIVESMSSDQTFNFTEDNIQFVLKTVAETVYQKSLDFDNIVSEHDTYDDEINKVMFVSFEVLTSGIKKHLDEDACLQLLDKALTNLSKNLTNIFQDSSEVSTQKSSFFNFIITIGSKFKIFISKYFKFIISLIVLIILLSFNYKHLINLIGYKYLLPTVCLVLFIVMIIYFLLCFFTKKEIDYQLEELQETRQKMIDLVDPNKQFERLGVDPIMILVGDALIQITDPDQEGELLPKIASLRQNMADEFGYIIPSVRVLDSQNISSNEYEIYIHDNLVDSGFLYPNRYLFDANVAKELNLSVSSAIFSKNPINKKECYWIERRYINDLDMALDPCDVLTKHLKNIAIQYVDYIITVSDIQKYIAQAIKIDSNISTDALLQFISYSTIARVFTNLLREKVSIKDLVYIFTKIMYYSKSTTDPDLLSEALRIDMRRQLCLNNLEQSGSIYAVKFSTNIEQFLSKNIVDTIQGKKIYLEGKVKDNLILTTQKTIEKFYAKYKKIPIILTTQSLRLYLYRFLVNFLPNIVVMSNEEIDYDINVKILDEVGNIDKD